MTERTDAHWDFDWEALTPADAAVGDSVEDTELIQRDINNTLQEAGRLKWFCGVDAVYWGGGIGGIVCVLLVKLSNEGAGVADPWVWLVSGDVPFAYIRADLNANPASALSDYIREMRRWVLAAKYGLPVEDLIPVGVDASRKNAEMLESRLDFLEQNVLDFL